MTAIGEGSRRFPEFLISGRPYEHISGVELIVVRTVVSGDLLVEARRRAGMSQSELARRSGVPASLIGRYERYEVIPSLERLRFLLKAAGFELNVRLSKVDDSNHDQVLIERELRRTPAERLRRGLTSGQHFGAMAASHRRVRA